MFFRCRLIERKSFFYANYFNWPLTSPVIIDMHPAVEPSWSRCLTEIVVYKYVLTVFPWILEVNACKEEKKGLSGFVLDSKTKEDYKIVLQRVGFEISRERQEFQLQSRKMAERASGVSFLGREKAKRGTKSREVPRRIKIGQWTFLEVYCSGREASILPGKCRTFSWWWHLTSYHIKWLL